MSDDVRTSIDENGNLVWQSASYPGLPSWVRRVYQQVSSRIRGRTLLGEGGEKPKPAFTSPRMFVSIAPVEDLDEPEPDSVVNPNAFDSFLFTKWHEDEADGCYFRRDRRGNEKRVYRDRLDLYSFDGQMIGSWEFDEEAHERELGQIKLLSEVSVTSAAPGL